MNRVFEDFLVCALREALCLDANSFPQGATRKGLRLEANPPGNIRLRPDLSWWRGGTCVFVGDAKYKRVTVRGVENADLYQLLAYTLATNLPSGLLVYAVGLSAERCKWPDTLS